MATLLDLLEYLDSQGVKTRKQIKSHFGTTMNVAISTGVRDKLIVIYSVENDNYGKGSHAMLAGYGFVKYPPVKASLIKNIALAKKLLEKHNYVVIEPKEEL